MTTPQQDHARHLLLVKLGDVADLNRARVAMTRLRVKTDTSQLTPEAKATRVAVISLVENLINAEIDTLLHDISTSNLRSGIR